MNAVNNSFQEPEKSRFNRGSCSHTSVTLRSNYEGNLSVEPLLGPGKTPLESNQLDPIDFGAIRICNTSEEGEVMLNLDSIVVHALSRPKSSSGARRKMYNIVVRLSRETEESIYPGLPRPIDIPETTWNGEPAN